MTPVATDVPDVTLVNGFLPGHAEVFAELRRTAAWEDSMSARETASYGVPYNYAQMRYPAAPMHPALVPVVDGLWAHLGIRFNNCLLNYYPDGRSKMGFHSDATDDLVPDTGVAIVSLGHDRKITFRGRHDPEKRATLLLEGGSLLFMTLGVQDEWAHAIKRRKYAGPRISLTWRSFVTPE